MTASVSDGIFLHGLKKLFVRLGCVCHRQRPDHGAESCVASQVFVFNLMFL